MLRLKSIIISLMFVLVVAAGCETNEAPNQEQLQPDTHYKTDPSLSESMIGNVGLQNDNGQTQLNDELNKEKGKVRRLEQELRQKQKELEQLRQQNEALLEEAKRETAESMRGKLAGLDTPIMDSSVFAQSSEDIAAWLVSIEDWYYSIFSKVDGAFDYEVKQLIDERLELVFTKEMASFIFDIHTAYDETDGLYRVGSNANLGLRKDMKFEVAVDEQDGIATIQSMGNTPSHLSSFMIDGEQIKASHFTTAILSN